MADEDFEEKELNYKRMCKDIIRTLKKIKNNLWIFDKFKLSDSKKKDLMEIRERLEKLNYPEYNNQTFAEFMDISCQVEDLLGEIDSAFKKLLKKIDSPSESDKKEIYSYFKIEKITPELRKSSNEFNLKLLKMSKLIQKIMDKYLTYYKEE
jgi:hypothetical protein